MQSRSFFVDTKVTLQEEDDADRAGIAMMGYTYSYIAIHSKSVKDENVNEYKKYYLSYFVGKTREVSYFEEQSVWENCEAHIYLQSNTVYLRMVVNDGAIVNYYYSENGHEYIQIGVTFQAVAGGWTGARPGIFSGNFMGRISQGYADFHYYRIKNCNCSEPSKFDQDMR
jgi:beta-xylosidase